MLLGGFSGAGGNHGLQRDQHAGLPLHTALGPFAGVARSDVGDERGFMQLTSEAVAAKATDQVQAELAFDQVLHGHRPIQQLSAWLDGGDPCAKARDPGIHQRSIRRIRRSKVVGPRGVTNEAIFERADIDLDQITLGERQLIV